MVTLSWWELANMRIVVLTLSSLSDTALLTEELGRDNMYIPIQTLFL